ncbi:hypothetical protein [Nocardioides zeae]|uniref:Uncharacterized protein n=1 Tax=Nocardioides zeae TaxID=1457234 RepID=A0AAJ1X1V9_9ACTN|nr:hypothetical protein [Nocardioides zeae]MDQ1102967.1 hypothetical protein [Nocardioides zeae]
MSAVPDEAVLVPVHGLGAVVTLRLRGTERATLVDTVRAAWERCLAPFPVPGEDGDGGEDGPVDGGTLDVVLDAPSADPAERHAAVAAGAVVGTALADVMHQLSPAVTLRLIERRAGALMMLHACALAHPETGRTAVLVAPSGTGKTTLARTLGTSFGYLTDETAGIDATGRLLPYPKPLSVIPVPGEPVKDQLAPAACGLAPVPADPRLAAVVLLERSPDGPEEPEVTSESTVRALATLAGQTSYLTRVERPLHALAATIEQGGGLRRVRYRESASLAPLLAEWLA